MQNVARGVGLSGLATLILACAMNAPATAVEVPQIHPPLPNVHMAPPKIAPPKITAPKSHVHAPTQPTPKGNALHPPKGLPQNNISNAPTGGGNTTGGGVKVLEGTPASPQTNPGGGTTTGGEAIGVNKQIDQPSPQGSGTTTGGEVNKQVGQPAPASGTPTGGEVNKQVGQPAPTGGTTTGGGLKVETGEVNQPSPPSGGTTIAGAPIVDLKTLRNALQQSTPPGGGTSKSVIVTIEALRDLLQNSNAEQASPSVGSTTNVTLIDPEQIKSVIDTAEQKNAKFSAIIKGAAMSTDPASTLRSFLYKLPYGPTGLGCGVGWCYPVCSSTETCFPNQLGGTTCNWAISCRLECATISFC